MILDRLTIKLPWPARELFPNQKARGNFRRHQDQREEARRIGFYQAKHALGRNVVTLGARNAIRLTFVMPNRINRDCDGMHGAVKHHIDGIAKALGVDDKVFRPVIIDDALDSEKQGFVLVDIFPGMSAWPA